MLPTRWDPACHTSWAAGAHLDSQGHLLVLLVCIHQILGKHLPPCHDSLFMSLFCGKKKFQKSSQCEKTKKSPFSPSLCAAVSRPSPRPSPPPTRTHHKPFLHLLPVLKKIILFVSLFLAVLGLHRYAGFSRVSGASHCRVFSCCRAQTLECLLLGLWRFWSVCCFSSCSVWALEHRLSSCGAPA